MEEREIWENRGNRCFCLIDRRKGTKGKAISIGLFFFFFCAAPEYPCKVIGNRAGCWNRETGGVNWWCARYIIGWILTSENLRGRIDIRAKLRKKEKIA